MRVCKVENIFPISGNSCTFMPLWARLLNSISSDLQVKFIYLIPPLVTQALFPLPFCLLILEYSFLFERLSFLSHHHVYFFFLPGLSDELQHMVSATDGCFNSTLCILCPKNVIIVKRDKCHPSFLLDHKF